MQMLDKFPMEGGQKDPKQRIIPFLPGGWDSLLPDLSARDQTLHLWEPQFLLPLKWE